MLEVLLPAAGTAVLAFLNQKKADYVVGLTTSAGERFLGSLWEKYQSSSNGDFERLAGAALAAAARRTADHREEWRDVFWRDSQKAALASIERSAQERFIGRKGEAERAVLDALLLGRCEGIGSQLASMLDVPESVPHRDLLIEVLAERFIEAFSDLVKQECHTKGRRALHRDLAWATHRTLTELRGDLAPLLEVDWEVVLARLDDVARERVEPPPFEAYFERMTAEATLTRQTVLRTEVAVSDLRQSLPDEIEARLAKLLIQHGSRLDARAEVERLGALLGESRAVILGLLKEVLETEVDPSQLEVALPDALDRLRETKAELERLREYAAGVPDVARAIVAAQGALNQPDVIDLEAAQDALRGARLRFAAAVHERREQESRTLVELLETEGSFALARTRFQDAADLFAEAAAYVPAFREEQRWRLELRKARALLRVASDSPELKPLEDVVELLKTDVLNLAPRTQRPLDWAETKRYLGMALRALGAREVGTDRLVEALSAHCEVLEERTRERDPLEWAAAMDSLGTAMRELGGRLSSSELIDSAVDAHLGALEERTRERVPKLWAITQCNLAGALHSLGARRSSTEQLERAVTAYREALEERTRERGPLEWASVMNNLSNALLSLGERESGTARIGEAIAAYRNVLEEETRERDPLSWAGTMNNLGNALQVLGGRESGSKRLEEAIAIYRESLEECTRARVPLQWAATHNNLGNTLRILGERESDPNRLSEAVEAYREALKERTRENVPVDWAETQNNLGNALKALGDIEEGNALLIEAVEAYENALEVRTREGAPYLWARTQNNLGNALTALGKREPGTELLADAIECYLAALEELREDNVPGQHVVTLKNLNRAMAALERRRAELA